jgi:hypothetical protein
MDAMGEGLSTCWGAGCRPFVSSQGALININLRSFIYNINDSAVYIAIIAIDFEKLFKKINMITCDGTP